MVEMQDKPRPRNSQPAPSPGSVVYQAATTKGWHCRPLNANNSQWQTPASWNGMANPATRVLKGPAPKGGCHWRDCRPATHTSQHPEHNSYLPSPPVDPACPTGLAVQDQKQGGNGWSTGYGASPPAVGGASWPQQAQQSSQTTASCLPGMSTQISHPLKPGQATRSTQVAYPKQRSMMSTWRPENRQSNQPQAKFRLSHVTHNKDTNKNQASRAPNRTDRISKVPFSRGHRFKAGPKTTFPAGLERVVMELPPIRECLSDVFANIHPAPSNR
ncbi:hypothetical protein BKA56DRAFT_637202 [Ilyonectria sp. MPI-CAGE-AT-0026]|nr:hypothetical protein BKA56DRAFT_637202 [Ilyonectria sp. MPI-CAGE-AT-0026]